LSYFRFCDSEALLRSADRRSRRLCFLIKGVVNPDLVLAAARARGRLGGRPKKMDAALIRQAQAMAKDKSITVAQICKTLGVSRNTYYKYVQPAQLKEHGIEQEQPNEYC
jgi:hypothetical protein